MKHLQYCRQQTGPAGGKLKFILFFLFTVQGLFVKAQEHVTISISGPEDVEVGVEYIYTITVNTAAILPSGASNVVLSKLNITSAGITRGPLGFGGIEGTAENTLETNVFTTNSSTQWSKTVRIVWGDWSDVDNALLSVRADYSYVVNASTIETNSNSSKYITIRRLHTPNIQANKTPQNCCTQTITYVAANTANTQTYVWSLSAGSIISQTDNTIQVAPPLTGNYTVSCTVKRNSAPVNYIKSATINVQRANPAAIIVTSALNTMCVGKATNITLSGSTCGLENIFWNAPNCTIIGQGTLNPVLIPNNVFANNTSIQVSASGSYTGGCGMVAASKTFTVYREDAISLPVGSLSSVNAPGYTNLYQVRKITFSGSNVNGATVTIEPATVNLWQYYYYNSATGQIKNYQYNTTAYVSIPVVVTYSNPCKSLQSTYSFTVPKPVVVPGQTPAPMLKTISPDAGVSLSYTIFPNPASNEINLALTEAQSGEIAIFDLQGKLCYQSLFDETQFFTIDLRQLNISRGIYLIKVDGSKNSFSEKIHLMP